MRDWGFVPSAAELAVVKDAQTAFRERWESIRPPFQATFNGAIEDVHALDYMDYEGIEFPAPGLELAALVCGEVVRRAAGLEWVITYRGDWFIASQEECPASVAICPLARLHELACAGAPASAKHHWFVQRAALDCLLTSGREREPAIGQLIDREDGYLARLQDLLQRLHEAGDPGQADKGGRVRRRRNRRRR